MECGNSLQICAMRVTLLNADGSVSSADDNSYVTDKLSEIGYTPDIRQGAQIDLECGCDGGLAATFRGRDILRRFGFQVARTAVEPGLVALMTGATAMLDGSDPMGVAWADDELGCGVAETKVALEFWTKNWVGDEQDATWPWWHHCYPATIWQIGDSAYNGSAFAPNVLNGFSRTNLQWGQGPYGDGPGYDIRRGGYWLDDIDPPAGVCGFQHATPGS